MSYVDFKNEIINDYTIAVTSRECSLLGRREVLTGKAKFGIFGDGKELPQLAMAKAFQNGDFRSGYYRDQTFMMAIDALTIEQFFSGLYAHTDINADPMSAGRQMGGHFGTHSLDADYNWKDLTQQRNSSADVSPTAAQMPRLLGLAQASKIYRHIQHIDATNFSNNGDEVAWGTIGNASTSEGVFFETINAAGVLQVPMVISVWDDEYGISVHAKQQTTKESISEILKGFQRDDQQLGYEILTVKGWDYASLIDTYLIASKIAREEHVPVLIHVNELTQPQGHSTSGSHERYKSTERLTWERQHDCLLKMRDWIISNEIATEEELSKIDKDLKKRVRQGKNDAWNAFINPIKKERTELISVLNRVTSSSSNKVFIQKLLNDLIHIDQPIKKNLISTARKCLKYLTFEDFAAKTELQNWINDYFKLNQPKYSSHLYSESTNNALLVNTLSPTYDNDAKFVDGRIIIRENFDAIFSQYPEVLIFGEDAGKIGDVNQGLEGLQEKYGDLRISDTGIREATIIGQGIGMAMRGLRPIAEIQYLDYLLYGLQILSDDLATLHYRTFGRQIAPLIIRTRGHRLEGIWHSGSPMGAILSTLRGINILVPRNMVQASGMYNSLLQCQEPALIIESLNGYRLKENQPNNLSEFTVMIGESEKIKNGNQITIVSYGSTLRLVEKASNELEELRVSCEIIDIQSLIPFDNSNLIIESLKKTNKLLIVDEDLPGGASSYILQKIIQERDGFKYLDSAPITLTSKAHRPAYGTDGDYFSKPSVDDIIETAYLIMNEYDPNNYPDLI